MNGVIPHHPFGSSKQGILRHCAGSYWMSRGLRSETEPQYRGRLVHERIASAIVDRTREIDVEGLHDAEVAAIERCLDSLEPFPTRDALIDTEVFVLLWPPGHREPLNWSWIDCLIIPNDRSVARVIDWKFYRSEIDLETLVAQLGNLAAPLLRTPQGPFERVEVHAYNPYDGVEYRTSFVPDDFDRIVSRIDQTITAAMDPNAPRCAGPWCKMCEGSIRCPEAQDFVRSFALKINSSPAPHAVPADRILRDVDRAQLAKSLAESWLDYARQLLELGHPSDEWELREKLGRRVIDNVDAAEEALVNDAGLTAEEFRQCLTVSVAKAEQLYATKQKDQLGVSKETGKRRFAHQLDGIVERQESSKQLVRKKRQIGGIS